jgi:hypothetical protein
MAKPKLDVQTPGAAQPQTQEPETAQPAQADAAGEQENDELPADMEAEIERRVQARVAASLPKPAAPAPAPVRRGPQPIDMADAVAQQAALPAHKRSSVLTHEGWYCPPGMGEQAKKD